MAFELWDRWYIVEDALTAPEGYGVGDKIRYRPERPRRPPPPMQWYLDQLGDA